MRDESSRVIISPTDLALIENGNEKLYALFATLWRFEGGTEKSYDYVTDTLYDEKLFLFSNMGRKDEDSLFTIDDGFIALSSLHALFKVLSRKDIRNRILLKVNSSDLKGDNFGISVYSFTGSMQYIQKSDDYNNELVKIYINVLKRYCKLYKLPLEVGEYKLDSIKLPYMLNNSIDVYREY